MDLIGGGPAAPAGGMGGMGGMGGGQPTNTCTAFQKAGLTITFQCVRSPENQSMIQLNASFTNATPAPMTKFVFQAAVPKDMKLQMQPASGNTVPAGNAAPVTQIVKILNPQNKPLRVMMKIAYESNGQQVQEQAVAQSFPAGF